MDEVITFGDKSFQLRLQEYQEVFSTYNEISAPEIKKAWSYYLEIALDPNGWQAIWKIPRLTCESLNIAFPTIVLVYVVNVNFEKLTACIKILAVQDDIHLPERYTCQLIHLWPTKEQDHSVGLNLNATANSIDMVRFFYNYIFLPWDYDDDESSNWVNKHLIYRLRLYYDMASTVPRATADQFYSLITEAKRLQARREQIETKLHHDGDESPSNEHVQTLAEINIQLLQIRSQVEMLENPLMRTALLKQQNKSQPKVSKNNGFWTVLNKVGTANEYIEFFEQVKLYVPHKFEIRTNLIEILEEINCDDAIILSIHEKENTVLTSSNENIMLDLGDNMFLENLTIDAASAQCGILVRRGKVTLKNCKIIGDGRSSIHQGIIVLQGSHLELINCEITEFHTAIVGNSKSKVTLKDCEIYKVNCGLKVFENSNVNAQSSYFHNCKEYGIVIESKSAFKNASNKVGDFGLLKFIPAIKAQDLSGNDNVKGNVIISMRKKIQPLSNLFSASNSNSTGSMDEEEEEMDCFSEDDNELNNTVIDRRVKNTSPLTI